MSQVQKDWTPTDIRVALLRAGVSQSWIARQCGVTYPTVYKVIIGITSSDRVRRAIADAIGIDVKIIWPSIYVYAGGPRKRGRPWGAKNKPKVAEA